MDRQKFIQTAAIQIFAANTDPSYIAKDAVRDALDLWHALDLAEKDEDVQFEPSFIVEPTSCNQTDATA